MFQFSKIIEISCFSFSWGKLQVMTNGSYADAQQAEAAGMAEGYITSDLINMHYHNTQISDYCVNFKDFCVKLTKFMSDNEAWIQQNIKAETQTDKSYWHQVFNISIFLILSCYIF